MSTEHDSSVTDRLAMIRDRFDAAAPPVAMHELRGRHEPHGAAEPLDPLGTDGARSAFARRRLTVGGVAAALVAVGVAGVWLTTVDDASPTDTIAPGGSAPATPAPHANDSVGALPSAPPSSAPPEGSTGRDRGTESIVDLVAGLDPFAAAELIWIDASYLPSPEEAADLAIANELASRACYEANGIELDAFDPARHAEWAAAERRWWDDRRSWSTPEGQARTRTDGYFRRREASVPGLEPYPHASAPIPEACYPAATSVTRLGYTSVWSQDQLFDDLLYDERWAPINSAFGNVPGTEAVHADYLDCMVERGWDWDDHSAYADLLNEPVATATEIEIANDDIDCRVETNAAAIYLDALSSYRVEFQQEFEEDLRVIERDRADALADAHAILVANGLDPFTG